MRLDDLEFTQGIYVFQVEKSRMTKIESRKTEEEMIRKGGFRCPL